MREREREKKHGERPFEREKKKNGPFGEREKNGPLREREKKKNAL